MKMKEKLKEFMVLTLGTVIMSVGIYFFKFPNNFTTGGVSGISVVLGAIVPGISPGTFVMIINVSLLIIGFIIIGKSFGIKTVYCSMLMSLLIYALERIGPMSQPLTTQPVLELVFAILLPACGSAILFNADASTGGTDIVAMVIKKYAKINISKALFISDIVIVMSTVFVFGIETWLFSLLGFLSKVFLVNNLLESINLSKYCTVIVSPENEEDVRRFITDTLHKTATVSEAYEGAYKNDKKAVFLVALKRKQAVMLKRYIKDLDSRTFMIISNTSDVCGRGFRETT